MSIKVIVTVLAPDDALSAAGYGPGALARLERAATEAGAYAEISTTALVASTYEYEIWDVAGAVTSWYRWRISNAGNTAQSAYSDAFQGIDAAAVTASLAYANLDDLLATFQQPVTDSRRLARSVQALIDGASQIHDELGFDFFRHPQAGTEARYFHGDGRQRLCVHPDGIASSVYTVEISFDRGISYQAVPTADTFLEPLNPLVGMPWDHIAFSGVGTYGAFPVGPRAVRVTTAFGWAEVPPSVRRANLSRARQLLAMDPSLPGGPVGPDQLGRPVGFERLPDEMWRLINARRGHTQFCSI